jgi:hypothetical protein
MKKENPEKLIPINDVYFSAFASLNNLTPKIQNRNGRVNFLFPTSEEFYRLVQNYYDNESVPVSSFAAELKKVRAMMWAAKEGGASHE